MRRYTTVLTVFLSAILVLSAIGTVLPPAYANPGHELNITPLLTGQGLSRELTGVVDEVTPEIHIHRYMVVMDPDEDFAIANNPDTCQDVVAEPGDRVWELQDANGDRVGSTYQAHAAGEASTLVLDDAFGSGDFTNSIEDLTAPTMTFHDETGGALDDHDLVAPDFQFQWRDDDSNPDDTETISLYHFVACGFIDLNGDDVFQSGVDLPDVIVETFRVVAPHTTLTKTADSDKVVAGDVITYTVRENNDGFVPLNEPAVVDSLGVALVRQADDPGNDDNVLEPGETWVYTGTYTTTESDCGELINTVTSSTTVAGSGFPADDEVASTSVMVICPAIEIEKTPDADKVIDGTEVTYEYKVTNTGDVELTDISVDDDVYGHIGDIASLAPGAMESLFHTAAIDTDTVNVATATGNHQLGTVTDSADAFVRAIHPAIVVEKVCDPETQVEPGTITYTIVVTNTGDVDLFVSVDDSMFGNIFAGSIAAGASEQFDFVVADLPPGVYTNTVTVTGEHQLGTVTASASATCEVTPGEFEGLTPGFWKNNAVRFGAGAWVNYSPGDDFGDVFGVDDGAIFGDSNLTLLEALNLNGGGVNALARHAVAALLNINNPDVTYPISEADLITAVQDALNSGDPTVIEDLKDQLDEWNNLGADIDQHWTP